MDSSFPYCIIQRVSVNVEKAVRLIPIVCSFLFSTKSLIMKTFAHYFDHVWNEIPPHIPEPRIK